MIIKLHPILARYCEPAGEGGSNVSGTDTGQPAGESQVKDGQSQAGDNASGGTKNGDKGDGEGGEGEGGGKPAISDDTAKLVKEVMTFKGKAADAERRATELAKQYEGIDPAEARALKAEKLAREQKDMEDRGEFDRVKAQMATQHQSELSAVTAEKSALLGQLAERDKMIGDMTVGNAFATSKLIVGDAANADAPVLTLTATKARVIYGSHFEFKDGKVVGFDKPAGASDRTVLVNSSGDPLSFDEALKKLVDADPDRDQLLRAKVKQGSGGNTANVASRIVKEQKKQDDNANMSPAQKISAGLRRLSAQ